jgi:pyruvate dehydrogenase E1 component alpha subunit
VCLFGDGATSKGDVYEAMNFAGVHKLPVVFVAANNQWAISVPLRLQTGSETLAQKAIAAGFNGEQVDGSDVVAMRAAAEEAIAAARDGKGPRFIEALTYRLGDHTTSDDASRYRSADEVQAHWKEEPIARLREPNDCPTRKKAWRLPTAALAVWPLLRGTGRQLTSTIGPRFFHLDRVREEPSSQRGS